jgi:penicillin G amidase
MEEFMALRGSNSWVISGKHTKSGKPILANDPHLPNSIPSIHYLMSVVFPYQGEKNFAIIGPTLPGVPSFSFGKNLYGAWGTTVLFSDITDLYQEKLDLVNNKYFVVKSNNQKGKK